jgi:ATPase subunit of ABC transporter with duplicated ATPase domains
VLKADALRAAHDAGPLFDDVSFVLADGERAGLVGPNGVGKSTLLRILAGLHRSEAGHVSVGAGDRVAYLEQQPPDPDLTLAEHLERAAGEVYSIDRRMRAVEAAMGERPTRELAMEYDRLQARIEALDGWAFRDTIDEIRRRIGIADLPDGAPLRELSGGQAARAMLAGVLLGRPTVLLLDEPTNHLDLDGIRWLEGYLAGFGGSLLVVTHDRRFLDHAVSWIYELDPVTRTLEIYRGGYSEFRVEKQRRFERATEEHRMQDRYRKRMQEDIARARNQARSTESSAGGPGSDKLKRYAKKVAKKAKARENRLQRQMGAAEWIERPQQAATLTVELTGASERGRRLVAMERVTAGYDGKVVLEGVDLTVSGRDRLAVTGPNGAGKSTLFRLLSGELKPAAGRMIREADVAVLPQSHDRLPRQRSVLEHYRSQVVGHEHEARAVLGWFLFAQEQLFRPLATLSAGERSRLLIAIMVMSGAELLLLDEPTNHLDFASIDVIERALNEFRGTVLAISHDREFIRNIGCDRVLEIRDRHVRELDRETPQE